jgi:gamma-glutamyltranspeptidase / glutathione hydrolase
MRCYRLQVPLHPHIALQWDNPYRTVRRPVVADNVVVTSQPLATQAGLRMLAAGGNAIDAAVAAAAVLAIVEPTNNGLGGDAFVQLWHRGELHGLNGSGRAPARWTRAHFDGLVVMPERGWRSVTVPGAVSAWCALAGRFARLPLGTLLEPAIRYAREGFPVAPGVAQKWAEQAPRLVLEPGFAETFLPEGRPPAPGERFRIPAAAATLERVAATNGGDFYQGETARGIVQHARATGGALEEEDLASHQPEWQTPLSLDYRGIRLHEMPPNGQGIVALMALGMLAKLDAAELDSESAPALHLQIEALKLAFADARRHVADPAAMSLSAERLLDTDYLGARARLIDRRRAQRFGAGVEAAAGTVYVATADAAGSVVSFIQSNYMGFGSGVVVPCTGVSLHNRGACFSLELGHPNEVGPGKRPYHTVLPGLAELSGRPLAALGSTGGTYQPQGHVQIALRLAMGQNPQAIVDAPRFRVGNALQVSFEPGFPATTLSALAALGHEVHAQKESSWDFGGMQIIARVDDAWLGASDARRDSQAAGF